MQVGRVVGGAAFRGAACAPARSGILGTNALLQFFDQPRRIDEAEYLPRWWWHTWHQYLWRLIPVERDEKKSLQIEAFVAAVNVDQSAIQF